MIKHKISISQFFTSHILNFKKEGETAKETNETHRMKSRRNSLNKKQTMYLTTPKPTLDQVPGSRQG